MFVVFTVSFSSFQHAKSWLHTNICDSLLHEGVVSLNIIVEDTNQDCACVVCPNNIPSATSA
jgi:hypothetical protein